MIYYSYQFYLWMISQQDAATPFVMVLGRGCGFGFKLSVFGFSSPVC